MAKTYAPFVYWAQSESDVLLRIDLKDVVDPDINLEEEEIEFSAIGTGSSGEKKLPWLKIDFDRIKHESESEGEPDANPDISAKDMLRTKYPEAYEKLQKEELGFISESKRRIYLFIYNTFMFCGFLYAFLILTIKYSREQEEFLPKAFSTVGNVFKFLQLMSILEVLNPLFGYTKGSVFEATIQVGGRLIFLFIMIDSEPRMQDKPVVFYLLLTYASIEIVRYPYYLFRVYDMEVGILTWLRYTIWVPLYPLGFICEGVIALRNIPYFEETEKFSVLLPNQYNLSFYFPNMIRAYLLFGFFPLLYTQMWHMYKLRCKRLGIKQHKSNMSKDD